VLGAEAALALRMLGPGLPDDQRTALRVLLGALAGSRLVGTGGRVRVLDLRTSTLPLPAAGTMLRYGDRAAVVLTSRTVVHGQRWHLCAVELGPPPGDRPAAALPGHLAIDQEVRPAGWADGGRLDALLRRFDSDGPPPWRPEAVQRLSELTGRSHAEAALLLAGVAGLGSYEANFLPKATRETLGLSVAEARTGREALTSLPTATLVAVLDAALPADPDDLWRNGPDVDRLAAAWIDHCGQKVPVDPELLAESTRVLSAGSSAWSNRVNAVAVVESVLGTATTDLLAPGGFTQDLLDPFAVTVAWLAYRSAVDDPVRPRLPDVLARLRGRLADRSFTVAMGYLEPGLGESPALAAHPHPHWPQAWEYTLTPARLSGPDDPVLRLFPRAAAVRAIAWLLSDECARLVEWVAPEGRPPGTFAHDPRAAVPSIVDSVAARLRLEPDAAAYYLQLLALPDPTDRNVTRWTGWTAKRIRQLGSALAEAGLAVAAKRERSGRSFFLPGAWLPLKAPNPPIEAWKAPLYGLRADGTPVLSVVVALMPVPSLFALAWQRVGDGDEPRLEQLGGGR
jgi:hypothetical protein